MRHHSIVLPRPKKEEYVRIFVVSCLHIGHRGHLYEKALGYRKHILETPDTYVINLGDDIENAIPGDEVHNSMMWDSNMLPAEQYRKACEFWEPVVDEGKLLLTHDSNHWWRTEAKTGISMAEQMNIFLAGTQRGKPDARPPKWGRWSAMTEIVIGKQRYVIHSTHGAGGATSPEAALRKCRETARYHHADVYMRGHHHQVLTYKDQYFDWREGRGVKQRERIYALTGCFMSWDESYAERAGYPPVIPGCSLVELSSRRHDARAST